MLSNLQAVLPAARSGGYAVGSFNVYSSETVGGVLAAARDMGLPAIVAFGANYLDNMDLADVAALVKTMAARQGLPVVLHLDHCKDFATIVRAVACGFTSVMYDGSALPFAENAANTAHVVAVAHAAGASVEAELGALALGERSNEEGAKEIYTSPEEAARFVESTGVDALAVSIGTVHGLYKGEPKVDLDVLQRIAAKVSIPLVLHGGSGTPEAIVRAAIARGIAKINVNTEISVHAVAKIRQALAEGEPHLSKLGLVVAQAAREVTKKYMAMFKGD